MLGTQDPRPAIRPFSQADLPATAEIHAQAFPRQQRSKEWIACNAAAYPRTRLYVAEANGGLQGFILWMEKSGFRSEVVLELEQIAVRAEYRNAGVGQALIRGSLPQVAKELPALYSADEVLMVARAPLAAASRQ